MEASRVPARVSPTVTPAALIGLAAVAGVGYALATYAVNPQALPFASVGIVLLALALWRIEFGIAAILVVAALGAEEPLSSGSGIFATAAAALTSAKTWVILVAVIELGRALVGRRSLAWPPIGYAAIVMLAAAALGVAIAPSQSAAAGDFFVLAGSVAVFLLIALLIDDWKQLRVVLATIVLVGLAISLHALWQYQTGHLSRVGFISESGAVEYRVASTFSHPNHLAGFLVIMVPVGIALYRLSRGHGTRIACAALVALATLATVITYSRGALLASIALAVVYTRTRRAWPIAAVACALVVLLAPATLRDRVAGIGDTSSPEIASRLDLWEAAGEIFEEHPVAGVGLDGFSGAYVDLERSARFHLSVYGRPVNAHNMYLNTLAEQGLVGVVALAVLLFALFRLAFLLGRSATERGHVIGRMLLAVAVVLVVHNFFDVTFLEDQTTSVLAWAVFGVAAATFRIESREASG